MQTTTVHNLTVALYGRVSTEEQRDGQTIDSQMVELHRFAAQNAWRVTGVYKDEGWSGSLLVRPELDRLRDDASKGLFHLLLVNDVDRLARDVTHLGIIKRDLERQGVQIIFKKLPAENTPTRNLMVNILGSFAEFEREMIADRTRRGKRHKVEVRKEYLGSLSAYGFRYVPKARSASRAGYLEIVPEEAAVVRAMYRWVDQEGLSGRQVVARLNQRKIPPRKGGGAWQRSSVGRILRSEIYAGVWHYNKHKNCEPLHPPASRRYRKSSRSSGRLRARTEWLPVTLPQHLQVIERRQWERVQRQLDQNRAFSPRNAKHTYLLSGLVHCGACAARYVGQPCHGKFYYRCAARCHRNPTLKEETLNQVVWNALREAFLTPTLIEEQIRRLHRSRTARATQRQSEARGLEDGLEELKTEESRVLEAYRKGILSPALLAAELEKLNARRAFLVSRRASLLPQSGQANLRTLRQAVRDYTRIAAERMNTFGFEERQRFLRLLIRSVVFDGAKVRILGVIPISHHQEARSQLTPSESGPKYWPPVTENAEHIAATMLGDDGRNVAASLPFELVSLIPAARHSQDRVLD